MSIVAFFHARQNKYSFIPAPGVYTEGIASPHREFPDELGLYGGIVFTIFVKIYIAFPLLKPSVQTPANRSQWLNISLILKQEAEMEFYV